MMPRDLRSDDALRELVRTIEATLDDGARDWRQRLARFLETVAKAPETERATPEFQQMIWESNPVSAPGMGTVLVDKAIADESFRRWLSAASLRQLSPPSDARVSELDGLQAEAEARLRPLTGRTPRLKLFRVLAAFFPRDFTTLTTNPRVVRLHVAMYGVNAPSDCGRHAGVLRRLETVLGPAGDSWEAIANRMTLPWLLYVAVFKSEKDATDDVPPTAGDAAPALMPLPAARRKKGISAIKGFFGAVLPALEVAREGVSRDDLLDHLRSESPSVKDATHSMTLSVLCNELGVLRRDGNLYVPTDLGEQLLESGDPTCLAPRLLTRVLGPDHVVARLRDLGPAARGDLTRLLQSTNPGWTSNWMPQSVLNWLHSLKLIESLSDSRLDLSDAGRTWSRLVTWTPEALPRMHDAATGATLPTAEEGKTVSTRPVRVPTLARILDRVAQAGVFPRDRVAALHAGLWANPRRHLGVLAGLSGSGKTLLARGYAAALTEDEDGDGQARRCLVAVQPGWADPSALFGYVNPLRDEAYVRTPFLDFLLTAANDPEHPHVAILDEMNLSHPEQYLAPMLSAMETGEALELHREGEVLDGVPSRLPYPGNVVLLGTVNMDETTRGLSDKVLDRASVLEFWDVDVTAHERWDTCSLPDGERERARALLGELARALAPVRLNFGWRVVDDAIGFLERRAEDGVLDFDAALDHLVQTKVLPKVRGDDAPTFLLALETCRTVLVGLPSSHRRVTELLGDARTRGAAMFWR